MPKNFAVGKGPKGGRSWPSNGAVVFHPSKEVVERIIRAGEGEPGDRYRAAPYVRRSDASVWWTVEENPGRAHYWQGRIGGGSLRYMRKRLANTPGAEVYWADRGLLYRENWYMDDYLA